MQAGIIQPRTNAVTAEMMKIPGASASAMQSMASLQGVVPIVFHLLFYTPFPIILLLLMGRHRRRTTWWDRRPRRCDVMSGGGGFLRPPTRQRRSERDGAHLDQNTFCLKRRRSTSSPVAQARPPPSADVRDLRDREDKRQVEEQLDGRDAGAWLSVAIAAG